jgi:hypothetical protein
MNAWASKQDYDDEPDHLIPNLIIMPATKAADCGVSSKLCRWSYRVAMPPSFYSIVQEMGRVDRIPIYDKSEYFERNNRYEIHILFICAVKLYSQIMQHPDRTERETQMESMMSILSFLVWELFSNTGSRNF